MVCSYSSPFPSSSSSSSSSFSSPSASVSASFRTSAAPCHSPALATFEEIALFLLSFPEKEVALLSFLSTMLEFVIQKQQQSTPPRMFSSSSSSSSSTSSSLATPQFVMLSAWILELLLGRLGAQEAACQREKVGGTYPHVYAGARTARENALHLPHSFLPNSSQTMEEEVKHTKMQLKQLLQHIKNVEPLQRTIYSLLETHWQSKELQDYAMHRGDWETFFVHCIQQQLFEDAIKLLGHRGLISNRDLFDRLLGRYSPLLFLKQPKLFVNTYAARPTPEDGNIAPLLPTLLMAMIPSNIDKLTSLPDQQRPQKEDQQLLHSSGFISSSTASRFSSTSRIPSSAAPLSSTSSNPPQSLIDLFDRRTHAVRLLVASACRSSSSSSLLSSSSASSSSLSPSASYSSSSSIALSASPSSSSQCWEGMFGVWTSLIVLLSSGPPWTCLTSSSSSSPSTSSGIPSSPSSCPPPSFSAPSFACSTAFDVKSYCASWMESSSSWLVRLLCCTDLSRMKEMLFPCIRFLRLQHLDTPLIYLFNIVGLHEAAISTSLAINNIELAKLSACKVQHSPHRKRLWKEILQFVVRPFI
eukprot:GHVT01023308.1.p1 GENE.GHVT01023308.1~~GHVT01023308.1.p1  ORF type:complete len:595 (+),score=144.42 GHVT01023308.1:31-1785(+)